MPINMMYWAIKARGFLPAAIAAYGKVDFKWDSDTANTWPAPKDKTIFGQLPHAQDGDIQISQSMAIVRYVSRKAGLQGDSDADFAVSEMLLEEFNDIFTMLAKAHYGEPRKDHMDKIFAETLPVQLKYLEKLLGSKKTFASKITAGDISIACIFNIILTLQPDALDAFPTLKAFYTHMQGQPGLDSLLSASAPYGMYFQRQ